MPFPYPHPIADLDAQETGGTALLQGYLQTAAASDKGQKCICFIVGLAQGFNLLPRDFKAEILRGYVLPLDVCDDVAKMVNMKDVPYETPTFQRFWLGRREEFNGVDSLTEFLEGYTCRDMGGYRSEYVAAVESRAHRVTPESWIDDLERLQLRWYCGGAMPSFWRGIMDNLAEYPVVRGNVDSPLGIQYDCPPLATHLRIH